MLIVFFGLAIISIYIVLLPKILQLPKLIRAEKATKQKAQETKPLPDEDPELMLAIAVALHLEQTNIGAFEKITWKRFGQPDSAWLTAGRMRGLAVRSHLPDHRS
jgi:Na+-transporting methylmalonyl-CoA/oxaloacetate decarboxylase gamma subunit